MRDFSIVLIILKIKNQFLYITVKAALYCLKSILSMFRSSVGHSMITNYLLNYFPGLDLERRNCHGFTAVMKAAMQGRAECVRALMMTGTESLA